MNIFLYTYIFLTIELSNVTLLYTPIDSLMLHQNTKNDLLLNIFPKIPRTLTDYRTPSDDISARKQSMFALLNILLAKQFLKVSICIFLFCILLMFHQLDSSLHSIYCSLMIKNINASSKKKSLCSIHVHGVVPAQFICNFNIKYSYY